MNGNIIISKDKYPVIQIISYLWIAFMAIYIDFDKEHLLTATGSVLALAVIFYFSFYAEKVVLNENELIKGDKLPFIKQMLHTEKINRSQYNGLSIDQNEKNYFQINVFDTFGNKMVLETSPNKIPAQKKLLEIEQKISGIWKL